MPYNWPDTIGDITKSYTDNLTYRDTSSFNSSENTKWYGVTTYYQGSIMEFNPEDYATKPPVGIFDLTVPIRGNTPTKPIYQQLLDRFKAYSDAYKSNSVWNSRFAQIAYGQGLPSFVPNVAWNGIRPFGLDVNKAPFVMLPSIPLMSGVLQSPDIDIYQPQLCPIAPIPSPYPNTPGYTPPNSNRMVLSVSFEEKIVNTYRDTWDQLLNNSVININNCMSDYFSGGNSADWTYTSYCWSNELGRMCTTFGKNGNVYDNQPFNVYDILNPAWNNLLGNNSSEASLQSIGKQIKEQIEQQGGEITQYAGIVFGFAIGGNDLCWEQLAEWFLVMDKYKKVILQKYFQYDGVDYGVTNVDIAAGTVRTSADNPIGFKSNVYAASYYQNPDRPMIFFSEHLGTYDFANFILCKAPIITKIEGVYEDLDSEHNTAKIIINSTQPLQNKYVARYALQNSFTLIRQYPGYYIRFDDFDIFNGYTSFMDQVANYDKDKTTVLVMPVSTEILEQFLTISDGRHVGNCVQFFGMHSKAYGEHTAPSIWSFIFAFFGLIGFLASFLFASVISILINLVVKVVVKVIVTVIVKTILKLPLGNLGSIALNSVFSGNALFDSFNTVVAAFQEKESLKLNAKYQGLQQQYAAFKKDYEEKQKELIGKDKSLSEQTKGFDDLLTLASLDRPDNFINTTLATASDKINYDYNNLHHWATLKISLPYPVQTDNVYSNYPLFQNPGAWQNGDSIYNNQTTLPLEDVRNIGLVASNELNN